MSQSKCLKQLLTGQSYTLLCCGSAGEKTLIAHIWYDSRMVRPGGLFVCLCGTRHNSHGDAVQAAENGAAAIMIQRGGIPPEILRTLPPQTVVVEVPDSRLALALCSARWFDCPASHLMMVGVTGTKGKTTVTHMLRAICEGDGRRVGVIGTNGVYYPGHHCSLNNTTPESYDLQRWLACFVKAGCNLCVMEVSSQGLKMQRVAGIFFAVGIFTNLSPDHIGPGEHTDFAEYRRWKGELFRRCAVGVINQDDPNAKEMLKGHTCRLVTYSANGAPADYAAVGEKTMTRTHQPDFLGMKFLAKIAGEEKPWRIRVAQPGQFGVENALAALAAARELHLTQRAIISGLAQVSVRGRVELVPLNAPFTVLLDYAHNADSAAKLLATLRAYHPTRLVVVFGCGGERPRLRRAGMGEVCARLADVCIVTEDNSRTEPLWQILRDIQAGMAKVTDGAQCFVVPQRLQALHTAMDLAKPGDIVAVIGKGHEEYLDCNGQKRPFPERELLEEYAAEKGWHNAKSKAGA